MAKTFPSQCKGLGLFSALGFPCGSAGKESTCKHRGTWFNPWVRKIPWRRERIPTQVFWPGEFHGLYSPWGSKESDTTERLSLLSALKQELFKFNLVLCYLTVGLPDRSVVKNLPANAGEEGLIPGLARSPGEGNGHPPQYSCLRSPMD